MTDEKEEKYEKEIEEFIETELDKDITQEDKIDLSVDKHINEMGWLFDSSRKKMEGDKFCFGCKRDIDLGNEKLFIAEAGTTEKGVFALVSLCEDCWNKLQEKSKKTKKDEV